MKAKSEKVKVYYPEGSDKPFRDPRFKQRGFDPGHGNKGSRMTQTKDVFKPGEFVDPKVQVNHPYTGKPISGNDFQSERGLAEDAGQNIYEFWRQKYPEIASAARIAISVEQTLIPGRLGRLTVIEGGLGDIYRDNQAWDDMPESIAASL